MKEESARSSPELLMLPSPVGVRYAIDEVRLRLSAGETYVQFCILQGLARLLDARMMLQDRLDSSFWGRSR